MASTKKKNPKVTTISGAIAGGIETTAVWPMEFIKTQLQLASKQANPKYNGMISCARYTYQTTGFLSFYRGLAPVLVGSIPKAGIRFGGFNYVQDMLRKSDGSLTPGRTLLAGMTAGAVESTLCVVPVETLKTRLIDSNQGMVSGTIKILKTEGVKGAYKGWLPTTLKQASNQGLRFMAFGQYKKYILKGENRNLHPLESLIGGMCSGLFSTMCNNPFDMIKTRMQGLEAHKYNGFVDCFKQVVEKDGFLALWSGVVPRLGRVVPGQGIIFMSFESISEFVEGALGED